LDAEVITKIADPDPDYDNALARESAKRRLLLTD
jgi:hypothetical protein